MAPNIHECLCEPVTLTIGLLSSSIQTPSYKRIIKEENDSSRDIIVKFLFLLLLLLSAYHP